MTADETNDEAPQTAAAIDIGTNAVRMVVAQIHLDNRIEVLERMTRPARLGHDTFRSGKLSREAVNSILNILRDYRQVLDTYEVSLVRAVASSAISEASNRDAILDRIARTVDLEVDVIEPIEQSRLAVSALRHAVKGSVDLSRGTILIADVGGGSTRLTVLRKGQIVASQDYDIGSVRMQDMLETMSEPPARAAEMLRLHVVNSVELAKKALGLRRIRTFIAIGGSARLAGKHVGEPLQKEGLYEVTAQELGRFLKKCVGLSLDALASRFGASIPDSERLVPGLLVYQALLQATRASKMTVSDVTMREGLLLDLPRYVTGFEDPELTSSILTSAKTIAGKYSDDVRHSEQVAELSGRVFDILLKEHGLKPRDRLLLQVAAQLHEIGKFVSNKGHHRHSQYLISHSEILGLRPADISIVSHVARYHRGGSPKSSHLEYMALPREQRMVINKLAGILRVADALYKGHLHRAGDFDIRREGSTLVVHMKGSADLTLPRRALAIKQNLFEDVFGMNVRLEEEPGPRAKDIRTDSLNP